MSVYLSYLFVCIINGEYYGTPLSAVMGELLSSDLLLLLSNLLSHLVGYSLIQCYALGNVASTPY